MSILRTQLGAGLALLLVFAIMALVGCPPEPDHINLTKEDCHHAERPCYR